MSKIVEEVLSANAAYAADFGARADLPAPPKRRFAILTCMDARMDPAKFSGLAEGDAHVFRNAGGRASDDAIRSLVISHKLLGTNEWFVIHHTDCGMVKFTDDVMAELLEGITSHWVDVPPSVGADATLESLGVCARTGANVVAATVPRLGPWSDQFTGDFQLVECQRTGDRERDVHSLTQAMFRVFEEMVRARPEQWYIFRPLWPEDAAAEAAS